MKSASVFLITGIAIALLAANLMAEDKQEEVIGVVPKGSASVGLTAFIDKGCYKCHFAGEAKLPELEVSSKLSIQLGERQSWTRDDFAQAIMNPSHTIAPEYKIIKIISGDKPGAENSSMVDFNDLLTLKDLINITTFLVSLQK